MNIQRDTEYRYGEFVQNPEYKDTKIHYTFVDLGLPSGTLWATCNVGVKNPWESGKYYLWGDLKGYTVEDTYEYSPSRHELLLKYTNNFNYLLDSEDDVAAVECGTGAHIPTYAQFQELNNLTNKTTINNYEGTGVKVIKYASKNNENFIIIPCSGYLYKVTATSFRITDDNSKIYLASNKKKVPLRDNDSQPLSFWIQNYSYPYSSTAILSEDAIPVRAVKGGNEPVPSYKSISVVSYVGDTSKWGYNAGKQYCAGWISRSGSDSTLNQIESIYSYGGESENQWFKEWGEDLSAPAGHDKMIVYGDSPIAHSHEPVVFTCRHYNNDFTSYTTETFSIPWKETSDIDNVEIYDLEHAQPSLPPYDEKICLPGGVCEYRIEKVQIGSCCMWYRWGGPEGGGGD